MNHENSISIAIAKAHAVLDAVIVPRSVSHLALDRRILKALEKAGNEKVVALEKALDLHLRFLDSLPNGWLGKTVADIGLLNDAYISSRHAYKLMGKHYPR